MRTKSVPSRLKHANAFRFRNVSLNVLIDWPCFWRNVSIFVFLQATSMLAFGERNLRAVLGLSNRDKVGQHSHTTLPVELAFGFLRDQDTQDGLLDARVPSDILFVRMAAQHVLLSISTKGVFVRLSHFVECDVGHDPHEVLLFHFKHELESTSSLSSRSVLT